MCLPTSDCSDFPPGRDLSREMTIGLREAMDETLVCGWDWISQEKGLAEPARWLGKQAPYLNANELEANCILKGIALTKWPEASPRVFFSTIRPNFSSPHPLHRKGVVKAVQGQGQVLPIPQMPLVDVDEEVVNTTFHTGTQSCQICRTKKNAVKY